MATVGCGRFPAWQPGLVTALGLTWSGCGRHGAWRLPLAVVVGGIFAGWVAGQFLSKSLLSMLVSMGGPRLLLQFDSRVFSLAALRESTARAQCAELVTLPGLTPQGDWGRLMLRMILGLQVRRFLVLAILASVLGSYCELPPAWWQWWLLVVLVVLPLGLVGTLLVLRGLLRWWGLLVLQFSVLIFSLVASQISTLMADSSLLGVLLVGWGLAGIAALLVVAWLCPWLWHRERWLVD